MATSHDPVRAAPLSATPPGSVHPSRWPGNPVLENDVKIKSLAAMKKRLIKFQEEITKTRDELRDFVDDANGILEDCEDAARDIECAIDALSRQQ